MDVLDGCGSLPGASGGSESAAPGAGLPRRQRGSPGSEV